MAADARLNTTPITATLTEAQLSAVVRAVTKERDRAQRRAGEVTKDLPGKNCFELTVSDLTEALGKLAVGEVTLTAHLWNQISWALGERCRVDEFWYEKTREERLDIVDQIENALEEALR